VKKMTRLKLTSPGVLLILAVLAAGGIFLLDLFCLGPHTEAQKWTALRKEAVRMEHATQLAIRAEQRSLMRAAAIWTRSAAGKGLVQPSGREDFEAFLAEAATPAEVTWVWVTDASGRLTGCWSAASLRTRPSEEQAGEIASSLAAVDLTRLGAASGSIRLPGGPGLFARQPISAGASSPGDAEPQGCLWLARALDAKLLDVLAPATGGKLVLVSGDKLPPGAREDGSTQQTLWLTSEDHLAVAWLTRDVGGRSLGYYLATVPVVHIHRQAATSRRIVLIVMALSMGLALLVILGSHMLITGPVVRLLTRLQRLESGEESPESLARNLHGEPLMLARRLENAFVKLAHISKTDELTGLANRRHFEQVLECFYHQARRYNRPLSVTVMDIDFFKAVNDAGGHQAGDDVLKQVSGAIEAACRKADLPARFGGDEFAVLLPETAAPDAAAVAERIREAVSQVEVNVGDLELNITSSLGIADLNAGEMDGPGAMMSLADRALYTAKQLGRNRVVQAHDLHVPPIDSEENETGKIAVLSKKLAGLDHQFKDLFVLAFEQVMDILYHRDPHMADHTRKVQHYATLIAREMELPERVIKRIEIAAVMHDIGMVALSDSILLCPTELGEPERAVMRRHPLLSVRIMERMEFLEQEIPAVRYHHERYDGMGYPEGISGAAIPLTARILAVADAFDAMTSPRTFRNAKTCAEALGEVHRASGTQFDPTVVNAFLQVADRLSDELMHVPGIGTRPRTTVDAHFASSSWREPIEAAADAPEAVQADEP